MARFRRIVHYSKHSRQNGHPGGVEKFAWYLQQCVDLEIVTPQDEPALDDPETLYVVDNHWGLDIDPKCRVICMLHGCAARRGKSEVASKQAKMAKRPNTRFISNSVQTRKECQRLYGVDSDIIHLAIDEAAYAPRRERGRSRWLTTTARKPHKGSRVVPFVKLLLPRAMTVETLSCPVGTEPDAFTSADGFFLLSVHEGFAYSVLEAMAANLPVVCGRHGLGYELNGKGVITTLDDRDLRNPLKIVRAMKAAMHSAPRTREWVLEHFSFQRFGDLWKEVIAAEQA